MPIIDEKKQTSRRIVMAMLKETGTIALHNDNVVYCFECMFNNHSHEMATF